MLCNPDCSPMDRSGPATIKLLVVGECPAPGETTPFTSPAGLHFREELQSAAIDPQKLGFCYAVSCHQVHLPSPELQATCNNRLEALIQKLHPAWLLLVGDVALRAFRPDLQMRSCHGRAFLFDPEEPDGSVCFPTFHHYAVERRPEWRDVLHYELDLLREMAAHRAEWMSYNPNTCVRCRSEAYEIDVQGVVYCERHWVIRQRVVNADSIAPS